MESDKIAGSMENDFEEVEVSLYDGTNPQSDIEEVEVEVSDAANGILDSEDKTFVPQPANDINGQTAPNQNTTDEDDAKYEIPQEEIEVMPRRNDDDNVQGGRRYKIADAEGCEAVEIEEVEVYNPGDGELAPIDDQGMGNNMGEANMDNDLYEDSIFGDNFDSCQFDPFNNMPTDDGSFSFN